MGHSTPFAICKAQDMSWPQADPLHSDRLALEPLAVDHASEMLGALAPPELYRFTGGEPPTPDELVARYRRQSQATLERKEDGLVADLAWLVTPEEQGRGIAVEAATTVVTWLRSIDVGHIRAFIHPDHTASMQVARRTGLAPTSALVDGELLWEAFLPTAAEH
jgi:hypothetical protein